jgi:hypothetical protein
MTEAEQFGGKMSKSLKLLLPRLAKTLGMSAPRLYERQQALIADGLLDMKPGKGPGSGVGATAPAIARLLTGVLGAETLAQTAPRVRDFLAAREVDPQPDSSFRGYGNFVDALAFLLTQQRRLASRVSSLACSRTATWGAITYRDLDGQPMRVEFRGIHAEETGLRVVASLDGPAIVQIAKDVTNYLLTVPIADFSGDASAEKAETEEGSVEG